MEPIIMMVAMLAIFYFILIRPENKRKKQAQEMRDSLKKGDVVTSIGGIVGQTKIQLLLRPAKTGSALN